MRHQYGGPRLHREPRPPGAQQWHRRHVGQRRAPHYPEGAESASCRDRRPAHWLWWSILRRRLPGCHPLRGHHSGHGSGLTGMNTDEMQHYFADLARDLADGSDAAGQQVRFDVDMGSSPIASSQTISSVMTLPWSRWMAIWTYRPGNMFLSGCRVWVKTFLLPDP